jgi:hypothetical protein
MGELDYPNRFVSLRTFMKLSDQYADFCRKIRFFIKGAFTIQEETLALEIISEFLDQKEKELEDLTCMVSSETSAGPSELEPVEVLLGRFLIGNEDYRIFQQIAEIRKNGGTRWEMLQSVLHDTIPSEAEHG